ncbi:DNA mismatch repair protein MutS [Sphingobacteriaceae bacterium WQ 2009]|uniref:DNA mismatch repair protein MutS n=1 Tax=Rhinopithecimicrobium faecis TaxID=2820698 RepID=A0A8T4H7D3_9SPHI|nr:DNA mismatch repair protein MutS [Sphingobacteriaceae bacterium WQ 2009]
MQTNTVYQDHVAQAEQQIQRLTKQINNNSLARLAVIIGGGALLFQCIQQGSIVFVVAVALAIILLFIYLINRQAKLELRRSEVEAFLRVNRNELSLAAGQANIYSDGTQFMDGSHAYTSDLDVFGSYSIFAQVNRAATLMGVQVLSAWFTGAATKKEVESRQQASEELATDLSWAQKFQAALLFNLGQKIPVKSFLANYFKDASFSFGNTFMRIYCWVGPGLLFGGIVYSIFVANSMGWVILLGLVHLLWAMSQGGKVAVFSSKIDKIGQIIDSYANAIALLESRTFTAAQNQALIQRLAVTKEGILLSTAFKSLANLINKLDARNNMLVGSLLNIFLLWDFRQVMAIAKWKEDYQENILEALDVIAEFEALLSLATYRRNHPTWVHPELLDDPLTAGIEAADLGHPLLAAENMVVNSYTSSGHTIALITGSNMAGKSTFLRTVGINAVLAYAGAVVCAQRFRLPIYKLISYMRIKDDLKESTSTFKAELDRMRFILQTVEHEEASFFLIDEMLRGTNSVDKYLGSRAIIKKLIQQHGKGMVATHDLQLASLAEEYPTAVRNYHFDIQVSEGEMKFDYLLKQGECKVFNASMLLKGIGIDVDNA